MIVLGLLLSAIPIILAIAGAAIFCFVGWIMYLVIDEYNKEEERKK